MPWSGEVPWCRRVPWRRGYRGGGDTGKRGRAGERGRRGGVGGRGMILCGEVPGSGGCSGAGGAQATPRVLCPGPRTVGRQRVGGAAGASRPSSTWRRGPGPGRALANPLTSTCTHPRQEEERHLPLLRFTDFIFPSTQPFSSFFSQHFVLYYHCNCSSGCFVLPPPEGVDYSSGDPHSSCGR